MKRAGALNQSTREKLILSLVILLSCFAVAAEPQKSGMARVRRQVLVSLPDRKLAVIEDGKVLAKFSIAVGAAVSPSPAGEFEVVSRLANPTYYHPGVVIPAGKGNPIGPRWLGLSQKGYGIHGTNDPRSIGHAASHGCIRLRNRDIERLYEMVRVGDIVHVRADRDEQTAAVFGSMPYGNAAVQEAELASQGSDGQ